MVNLPPDRDGPEDHGAGSIRVLRGLEAVRLRPQMYVGDVRDGSGLHTMFELAVADAIVRRSSNVTATLEAEGTITVIDDGDPFPGSMCPSGELLARQLDTVPDAGEIEQAATIIASRDSGRLPVVNALSSRMQVKIWRGGHVYAMVFADGAKVSPLEPIGPWRDDGIPRSTEVSYTASTDVFGPLAYDRAVLNETLLSLGRRNPRIRLTLA